MGEEGGDEVRIHHVIMPSKELLLSLPLMVVAHATFTRHSSTIQWPWWRLVMYADLISPLLPLVLSTIAAVGLNASMGVLRICCAVTSTSAAKAQMPRDACVHLFF